MTKTILEPKIKATGLVDILELGLFKSVSERAIARTPLGNGTHISAIGKGVGGSVLHLMSKNKHVQLLGSALIVDAVEDAIIAVLGDSDLGLGFGDGGENW